MNYKKILTALATTLALGACSDYDSFLPSQSEKGKVTADGPIVPLTFTAEGEEEQGEAGTRTTLSSDGKKVLWETGDQIAVYDTPLSMHQFTLASGAGTTKATFTGEAVAADVYYAMYPIGNGEYTDEDGVVDGVDLSYTQPSSQTEAAANNIPVKKMMGRATSADNTFAFKNVTARLDFNLSGFGSTVVHAEIYFNANGGETLAGTGAKLDWNNGEPCLRDFTKGYAYVVDPDANYSTTSRMYINPGVLESGFTICLSVAYNNKPAEIYYYHKNDSKNFERNKVYTFNLTPTGANGIGSVDLGLPSGTLFNVMNYGAMSITYPGGKYAWGELATKTYTTNYYFLDYKFMTGTDDINPTFNKYVMYANRDKGVKDGVEFYDGKGALDAEDDLIASAFGGNNHIPTADEMKEFIANTTVSTVSFSGSTMYKCTSKINGKSVYFPKTGWYEKGKYYGYSTCALMWTKSAGLTAGYGYSDAYFFEINDNGVYSVDGHTGRNHGHALRGVHSNETHQYVDMGEAGKWSSMNVGATVPEDYGDHYAWGETTTKSTYTWANYKWGTSYGNMTKYTTNTSVLTAEDDAATANWGSNWRTPTAAEFAKLIEVCDWTKHLEGAEGYSGVEGWIGTHKENGNKIFFPSAGTWDGTYTAFESNQTGGHRYGYYWTSDISSNDQSTAKYFKCVPNSDSKPTYTAARAAGATRYKGFSIRPIRTN